VTNVSPAEPRASSIRKSAVALVNRDEVAGRDVGRWRAEIEAVERQVVSGLLVTDEEKV
jgi:hypothetical protein